MHRIIILILALLTILSAKGEVSSHKKRVGEPVVVDTLAILLQKGDSLMQQYNTFEALKYYQQAYQDLKKGNLPIPTERLIPVFVKLADCYYKRADYHKAANLLKLVPEDSLTHESFRQLAFSYQKQNDPQSLIYWGGRLVAHYPMDGEMVAAVTAAFTRTDQAWAGIDYAKGYFERDSTNILVNRALADAYFMDRQFEPSAAMYERLLHQGDSTFNTLYSAGMCYAQIDSLELAYQHLKPAFFLSQMQHAGCAYRLGVVCVDTDRLDEGLGYLDIATALLLPDTTTMKAITLSRGEAYYLLGQYDKAVEVWKDHLKYNPSSIATYYNIASATYYYLQDGRQAKTYFERFLEMARKEETPNAQLTEMIKKAEELLQTANLSNPKVKKIKKK